jgi:predicted RNA-binding protein with RPS1 domain
MEDFRYNYKFSVKEIEEFMKTDQSFKSSILDPNEKMVRADLKMRQLKLMEDTKRSINLNLIQMNYKKNM